MERLDLHKTDYMNKFIILTRTQKLRNVKGDNPGKGVNLCISFPQF